MAVRAERRVPLSRERVLRAAMRMVDDGGIGALSMRKLGQALGVEAMSLYNHVANKDDILAGITDLVLAEFELPSGDEEWVAAIHRCAISAHDALLRHPWACNLIMAGPSVRPARLFYIEALLRRFREAGFSPEEASRAYHAIDSHILGFTLWELGHMPPGDSPRLTAKEEIIAFLAAFLPGFAVSDYSYLLEHADVHLREPSPEEEGDFEFELRLILDGLRRMREES
jgi:AcrR family transcriptional regulator